MIDGDNSRIPLQHNVIASTPQAAKQDEASAALSAEAPGEPAGKNGSSSESDEVCITGSPGGMEPAECGAPAKIFIVHSSHTGGHASAARSVETALKREPGAEVENINTMKLTPEGVQAGQVKLFNVVSDHFKSVKTWAFRKSFEGSDLVYWLGNTGLKLKALASKPFLNKIKEENPDIILSTHSQTNSLLSYWKGKGLIDQPIHSVVTDFSAHRMWAQDHIDHYYVATESVKHDLERFGVPSEKIEVTGIPINPDFATKQSTPIPELKKKLGLDPDLPVVLMLGGSLGYGSFAEVSQALDTLKTPLQIVAITAKNAEKKQELEELAPALKKPLNVQGYVSNMKEWMEASDVIISKPGGLTTSEIFAVRKPMIIIDPMAGLEQILYPKIVETGCAEVAKDPEDAAAIIDRILTDSKFKEIIDDNLEHVGKPDAAFVVAEDLLRSAREKHD